MNKQQIINKTAEYVKTKLAGEGTGHDWWHTERVWKMAVNIGKREKADLFIVQLAALLHDIADWKFNDGNDEAGPELASIWLKKLKVEEAIVKHICQIIKDVSFKGPGVKSKIKTKEGMAVQDADRLDALGAMGISRTFAYGGSKGREIYNPKIKPQTHRTFKQYKNNHGTSINHFYEKLLLLKNLMNTATAKKIAARRHKFIEKFLAEFFKEWEGKN